MDPSPHLLAAKRLHTDALLRLPNVVAVGIGNRRVGGDDTGEPAVVVSVTHKLPGEALRPGERVPRMIAGEETEVRTDVVEVGVPRLLDVDDATYRPLRGGCQIGTASGGTGTAGAVMYDRRDQRPVLLTNNHVLTDPADPSVLPVARAIFQPAGSPDRIGESKRIVPLTRAPLGAEGYHWEAAVDAGIVSLDGDVPAEFEVVDVGAHPYVVLRPYVGLEVVRRGFRTQLKPGTVEQVRMTVIVEANNGQKHRIGGSEDVFMIRSPEGSVNSMPGDSGSLVVDAGGAAARGLVFAGSTNPSDGVTWACELGTVMTMLELDTPCTGSLNALIRRSVLRRLADRWAVSEQLAAAAGTSNTLVAAHIEAVTRFRHAHLRTDAEGTSQGTSGDSSDARADGTGEGPAGGAVGAALHRLAPALATVITRDEDAAGLLERAFGEWLVQPTVFDLLEYRFSGEATAAMADAFERLRHAVADPRDLDVVAGMFLRADGRSVRELVTARDTSRRGRVHGMP